MGSSWSMLSVVAVFVTSAVAMWGLAWAALPLAGGSAGRKQRAGFAALIAAVALIALLAAPAIYAAGGFASLIALWLAVAAVIALLIYRTGASRHIVVIGLGLAMWHLAIFAIMGAGLIFGSLRSYVVPTGAMAPAIYGNHRDMPCSACGYVTHTVEMFSHGFPVCANCGSALLSEGSAEVGGDRVHATSHRSPRRWDMIVFKNPQRPVENYVKRLVALPGETVQIVGGDIFINGRRAVKRPLEHPEMWDLVHDTSLMNVPLSEAGRGWTPAAPDNGWRFDKGKWVCKGAEQSAAELLFRGNISPASSYGRFETGAEDERVSDIRLACRIDRLAEDGSLHLRWKRGGFDVESVIHGDGRVGLHATYQGLPMEDIEAPLNVMPGTELALIVRDGMASVLANGEVKLYETILPSDVAAARQMAEELDGAPGVMLTARGDVVIDSIVLSRDVHYTNVEYVRDRYAIEEPLTLGHDEFFALGDNSPQSEDCRFFGPVPVANYRQIMLFRYGPPSRAAWLNWIPAASLKAFGHSSPMRR